MRLLCPFCQQAINVADTEAGKAVNCPLCQQMFAAPYLHVAAPTPAPVPPPPAPLEPTMLPRVADETPMTNTQATSINALAAPYGLESTSPPVHAPSTPAVPLPPMPTPPPPSRSVPVEHQLSGYQHVRSLPLNIDIIRWIPAAAFFLIFILSLFSWVGMYPGGYSAYTQNAWQCLFAGLSEDKVAEDEMKMAQDLRDALRSNWWLLPYLVLLLPTMALAAAGPLLAILKINLPTTVNKILQYRAAFVALLAVLTMLLLAAQWSRGFGLEHATMAKLDERFAESKKTANTPEKEQRWEMNYAAAAGTFHLKTTFWLRLAFFLHLLAAFAVAAEAALQLRGNKPAPRVGVMW